MVVWKRFCMGCRYPSANCPSSGSFRTVPEFVLLVDHEAQRDTLESFGAENSDNQNWDVSVKIDVGSRRAGLPLGSPRLENFISRTLRSRTTVDYAQEVLQRELDFILQTADLLPMGAEVTLSFGFTPAAHVVQSIKRLARPNLTLELHVGKPSITAGSIQISSGRITVHAGNYVANDPDAGGYRFPTPR
ncbi:hypothetical protein B0H63DRAFT_74320 [Podospora didyma]|uniref:Uncharacterized protein n=1 Tax=Podospora didyma TaxID=330526 RepID=A0AAE0K1L2_9PEZI|nr:hypothetical protein B0H63DRAFT_74320 [Podospora didyma]